MRLRMLSNGTTSSRDRSRTRRRPPRARRRGSRARRHRDRAASSRSTLRSPASRAHRGRKEPPGVTRASAPAPRTVRAVSLTGSQATPYTAVTAQSHDVPPRRSTRRLRAGARLAVLRRPRDRAPPAEPRVLPDLRRGPRGAAARARSLPARRTTTGSSPTTATARSRSRSASRRSRCCCRRSARPTIPRQAAARCRATGARRALNIVSQTSCTGEPVPARGRVRGGGALHRPPAATRRAATRTATSSRTCRSARARRRRASSGSR